MLTSLQILNALHILNPLYILNIVTFTTTCTRAVFRKYDLNNCALRIFFALAPLCF